MSDVIMEGRCHCGAVSVSIPAQSVGVVACHCQDCQRLHGNFFAMLVVERERAQWRGKVNIAWYPSSKGVRRGFCRHCGSRLLKDPARSPKVMVSIGLFEPGTTHGLLKNVWSDAKPHWYELPETWTP